MNEIHSGIDHLPGAPTPPAQAHSERGVLGWWPSFLGVGIAVLSGGDSGVSTTLASVVMLIALIYVVAAVTDRQVDAWWGLLASLPVVLAGEITGYDPAPFLIMGASSLVLIIVGWARGAWAQPRLRAQLYGLAGFAAVAVAAAVSGGTLAAVLIAVGLLTHAGWDVVHLVRNQVVGRRYAEFCVALDTALAIALLWGLR